MTTLYYELAFGFALWLSLACLWLYMLSVPTLRARSRRRRRGGYVKPHALRITKVVTTLEPPAKETTGSISSPYLLGSQSEAAATLVRRVGPSRLSAPTAYGSATAGAGGSGQRPEAAA
jgi:hypothetical protein